MMVFSRCLRVAKPRVQTEIPPDSVEKPPDSEPVSVSLHEMHWICCGETGQPERRRCFNMNTIAGPATWGESVCVRVRVRTCVRDESSMFDDGRGRTSF